MRFIRASRRKEIVAVRAIYTAENNMVCEDPKVKLGDYVRDQGVPAEVLEMHTTPPVSQSDLKLVNEVNFVWKSDPSQN